MSVSVRNRSVNTEASDDEMVVTDTTADAAETGFTWTTRIRRKLKHSITIILQNHEKKWSHENICCNSNSNSNTSVSGGGKWKHKSSLNSQPGN